MCPHEFGRRWPGCPGCLPGDQPASSRRGVPDNVDGPLQALHGGLGDVGPFPIARFTRDDVGGPGGNGRLDRFPGVLCRIIRQQLLLGVALERFLGEGGLDSASWTERPWASTIGCTGSTGRIASCLMSSKIFWTGAHRSASIRFVSFQSTVYLSKYSLRAVCICSGVNPPLRGYRLEQHGGRNR